MKGLGLRVNHAAVLEGFRMLSGHFAFKGLARLQSSTF